MINSLTAMPEAPHLQLSGRTVWLRPPEMDDWAQWAALREASRDFLVPWEPSWPVDSLTRSAWQRRLRRQYEEWHHDLGYSLLIFSAAGHALLGGISLSNVRRGVSRTATMGYWIGQPHARKGYTSEAATLLLNYAFETLTLHRIEAGCVPGNMASRSLLKKLQFREEGYARDYLRINGKWEDHVLFGMLSDEWQLLRSR
jgi:ribosomal-protein-alanine N-acetyltransferase